MVGTPESGMFFEQAMYLARRSIGLKYTAMECDKYFHSFCQTLFEYQYTKNKVEISKKIVNWLYEHSTGVVSVVVSLVHDAQEIAILNSKKTISIETLNEAYQKRLSMLHDYIEPNVVRQKQTSAKKKTQNEPVCAKTDVRDDFSIVVMFSNAGQGHNFRSQNSKLMNKLKSKDLVKIGKAISYYIKSTKTLYKNYIMDSIRSIWKDFFRQYIPVKIYQGFKIAWG